MILLIIPFFVDCSPSGDGILAVFRDWKNSNDDLQNGIGREVRDHITRLKSKLCGKLTNENHTTFR